MKVQIPKLCDVFKMVRWKQALLTLYYHATRPMRACRYWRQVSKDRLPLIILFYHRIADDLATPWTISNAIFIEQLRWLQERFRFVSLAEVQERIRRGYNSEPCVSITFDDGYGDNCDQAIPWLIKERIPCTYFVTLHNLLTGELFAHDIIMGNRLAPNTLNQVKAMAAAGVEIGCHAYTHADIGPLTDPRLLNYEIATAKEELQKVLGTPVRYFAFPFGQHANMNTDAFNVAKQAGFAGVCSAYGGLNFPGDDPFHLQRIPVDNDLIRMQNWVTQDPRKDNTPRFVYEKNLGEASASEKTGRQKKAVVEVAQGKTAAN
jgi:peptidoglycan/xylan/chitin deacetylase (PgdA/CDA1 family)